MNGNGSLGHRGDFDAIVVGASLAGCTTSILLARSGAGVLLLEKAPDPAAYKKVCGHYIVGGAVPVLRRLGVLEAMIDAGAVRSQMQMWTPQGWIEPPPAGEVEASVNLRRVHLDPILRGAAAAQDGVNLRQGQRVTAVTDEGGQVAVEYTDQLGVTSRATAAVLIGADGYGSTVASLAGFKKFTRGNGRFNFTSYFEGPPPAGSPNATGWFLNPLFAGAFPTDSGLTGYYIMPTKAQLPEFKADPEGSIRSVIAELPGAPPGRELKLAGEIVGRVNLKMVARNPARGRVALVGDAAMTNDPLFGTGCGWAFLTGSWLADALGPALAGERALDAALRSYRWKLRRTIYPDASQIESYASGRKINPVEAAIYRAGSRDPRLAPDFARVATRSAPGWLMFKPRNLARIASAQIGR
jgi:2-polyprenyl-6-methoxyphenol hydroxylase-like FAD-dependent oxidoreductase